MNVTNKLASSFRSGGENSWIKLGLAVAAMAAYVLAFIPPFQAEEFQIAQLAAPPIVVFAWLFGFWGGVTAAVFTIPFNAFLFSLASPDPSVTFQTVLGRMQEAELLQEVVVEIVALHRRGLVVLLRLVLGTPASRHLEAVHEDLLPVHLVVAHGLVGDVLLELDLALHVGFAHLQEGVLRHLLLQMLLEIQQRHVEQLHRLVEAWVDPHLLSELGALEELGVELVHISPERRAPVGVSRRRRRFPPPEPPPAGDSGFSCAR